MKKLSFLLLLPLLSLSVSAQRDCFVTHGLEIAHFGGFNFGNDLPNGQLEHLRLGQAIMVTSEFHFTHRLSAISGVGLTGIGYRSVETSLGGEGLHAINNTVYNMSVPLDLKYRWANRRGGLYTRFGFAYELGVAYRARLAGADAGALSPEAARSHRAWLRGNHQVVWTRLAMGYEFRAVRDFIFHVEPIVRFSINKLRVDRMRNSTPDGSNLDGRALLLGLSVGVRI